MAEAWAGTIVQSLVRRRNAAAASAEPPPTPDATRQILRKHQLGATPDTSPIPQRLRGPQDQIVVAVPKLGRELPLNGQRKVIRRTSRQTIPISAEGEHRLDGVAAIGQLSAHMEGEVDLGRSRLFELHQGAAVAGVRPVSILAFSRVATSSSAV